MTGSRALTRKRRRSMRAQKSKARKMAKTVGGAFGIPLPTKFRVVDDKKHEFRNKMNVLQKTTSIIDLDNISNYAAGFIAFSLLNKNGYLDPIKQRINKVSSGFMKKGGADRPWILNPGATILRVANGVLEDNAIPIPTLSKYSLDLPKDMNTARIPLEVNYDAKYLTYSPYIIPTFSDVKHVLVIGAALKLANDQGMLEPFKHPKETLRKLFAKTPGLKQTLVDTMDALPESKLGKIKKQIEDNVANIV